jgi:hypothetical protein
MARLKPASLTALWLEKASRWIEHEFKIEAAAHRCGTEQFFLVTLE